MVSGLEIISNTILIELMNNKHVDSFFANSQNYVKSQTHDKLTKSIVGSSAVHSVT